MAALGGPNTVGADVLDSKVHPLQGAAKHGELRTDVHGDEKGSHQPRYRLHFVRTSSRSLPVDFLNQYSPCLHLRHFEAPTPSVGSVGSGAAAGHCTNGGAGQPQVSAGVRFRLPMPLLVREADSSGSGDEGRTACSSSLCSAARAARGGGATACLTCTATASAISQQWRRR